MTWMERYRAHEDRGREVGGLPEGPERTAAYEALFAEYRALSQEPDAPKVVAKEDGGFETAIAVASILHTDFDAEALNSGLKTPVQKFVGASEFYVAMLERSNHQSAEAFWKFVEQNYRYTSLAVPPALGIQIRAWVRMSQQKRVEAWPELWAALTMYAETDATELASPNADGEILAGSQTESNSPIGDGSFLPTSDLIPESTEIEDKLPKKSRKISPSRIRAAAAYDWAISKIANAESMTIVELHEAIQLHGTAEVMEMIPSNAESFGRYLRDAGVKRYDASGSPIKTRSVRSVRLH